MQGVQRPNDRVVVVVVVVFEEVTTKSAAAAATTPDNINGNAALCSSHISDAANEFIRCCQLRSVSTTTAAATIASSTSYLFSGRQSVSHTQLHSHNSNSNPLFSTVNMQTTDGGEK